MIRPVSRCLNAQLQSLCQNAIKLDELNDKIKANLPSPLKDHCAAGSFKGGCLLITTENSAWSTELRYRLPELRDSLRKAGFYQLTSIKIAIANTPLKKEKPKKGLVLSKTAKDNLRNASEGCDYLPLKEMLLRLANRENEQVD
ncbi:MAG: DUF721 domain-containing protein [Tatlockia sp.]|jgi:hypothetical protein